MLFELGSAAVSLGVAAYGMYQKNEGMEKQKEAEVQRSRIAGEMAQTQAEQSIAGARLSAWGAEQEAGLNIEASEASYQASAASVGINKQVLEYEKFIESKRREQMEVTGRRDIMQVFRNRQAAESMSLATAVSQGASRGSGLAGARGAIAGQSNFNLTGILGNLSIGRSIFDTNALITGKKSEHSDLELAYARQRADIQTRQAQLKSSFASSAADITTNFSRRTADLQTQYSKFGGMSAEGAAQSQYGGSLMSAAPSIFSAGQAVGKFGPSLQSLFSGPDVSQPLPGSMSLGQGGIGSR